MIFRSFIIAILLTCAASLSFPQTAYAQSASHLKRLFYTLKMKSKKPIARSNAIININMSWQSQSRVNHDQM